MNVIKFLLKFKLLTITLLSVISISMSSISYAHSYPSKVDVKYQSRIQVIPVARVQSKLLPKALYLKTLGHTFKRKFAFQNRVVKHVYYDASQPTHKLYASISPTTYSTNDARNYWP